MLSNSLISEQASLIGKPVSAFSHINSLPEDLLLHIGTFAQAPAILALAQIDKQRFKSFNKMRGKKVVVGSLRNQFQSNGQEEYISIELLQKIISLSFALEKYHNKKIDSLDKASGQKMSEDSKISVWEHTKFNWPDIARHFVSNIVFTNNRYSYDSIYCSMACKVLGNYFWSCISSLTSVKLQNLKYILSQDVSTDEEIMEGIIALNTMPWHNKTITIFPAIDFDDSSYKRVIASLLNMGSISRPMNLKNQKMVAQEVTDEEIQRFLLTTLMTCHVMVGERHRQKRWLTSAYVAPIKRDLVELLKEQPAIAVKVIDSPLKCLLPESQQQLTPKVNFVTHTMVGVKKAMDRIKSMDYRVLAPVALVLFVIFYIFFLLSKPVIKLINSCCQLLKSRPLISAAVIFAIDNFLSAQIRAIRNCTLVDLVEFMSALSIAPLACIIHPIKVLLVFIKELIGGYRSSSSFHRLRYPAPTVADIVKTHQLALEKKAESSKAEIKCTNSAIIQRLLQDEVKAKSSSFSTTVANQSANESKEPDISSVSTVKENSTVSSTSLTDNTSSVQEEASLSARTISR